MPRRLLIAVLAGLVLAGPARAAPAELIPGLTYDRQVQFTINGPVVANVLTAPRPGGLWQLKTVLSNDSILGTERLTAIEARLSAAGTAAGVNGDLFNLSDGHPSGIVMRGGALDHAPLRGRSSVGVGSDGALHVDRVALLATWQGTGQRRAVNAINAPPGRNGVSLFTPAWGTATPARPGAVEVVLQPLPAATPNTELSAPVVGVSTGGLTGIPPDGAVLSARGVAATKLQEEAIAGQPVRLRLILKPSWGGVVEAIGGGPALVRKGKAVFESNEQFGSGQLLPRTARTAVGQLADGRILLVAVDGAQPGYSAGVTNFELALLMIRLGAVTASALDGGGSTTMAFDGQLLNRPLAGERAIGDALVVLYGGVYVPPPLEPVLSPNGDGIADRQRLSYRVARQSTVTATLAGPDGVARSTFEGPVAPGTYPLDWDGKQEDGSPAAEGRWIWSVTATDDTGQTSALQRAFQLNDTIGFPRRVPPILAVPRAKPRAVAAFTLTRAARIQARIATVSGAVLRTLPTQTAGPGELEIAWDGRTDEGALVYPGRYVAEVTAINELGRVSLAATFSIRHLPSKKPKAKPAAVPSARRGH